MKTLMDFLVVFVAKKDEKKIVDTEQFAPVYCEVSNIRLRIYQK
jgi:hypothetical protein